MPKVHNLKIETQFFKDVNSGLRQFEVRKNDRNFEVGDTLILEEFDPNTNKYLRGWIPKLITHKLDDTRFVKEGFIILSLKDIDVSSGVKKKKR